MTDDRVFDAVRTFLSALDKAFNENRLTEEDIVFIVSDYNQSPLCPVQVLWKPSRKRFAPDSWILVERGAV